MNQLKRIMHKLKELVAVEVDEHIDTVDAKELGEVVDMIKDISETIYYCTITEAMEGKSKVHYSSYPDGIYTGEELSVWHLEHGGNSHIARQKYMEAKKANDKQNQMQELEKYAHELTTDVMDMIKDATVEEKAMLQQKIQMLATKIK